MKWKTAWRWRGLGCVLASLFVGVCSVPWVQAQPTGGGEMDFAHRLDDTTLSWLESHRRWRVGVVRDWAPIDGVDASGRHTGASGEVLGRIARLARARIEPVAFDDFQSALEAARDGRVDLLGSVARTPERERTLQFTDAYLQVPVVYIARRGTTDFSESNDFGGRVVAVERGFVAHELLRTRFPRVQRLEVESTEEALSAVAQGRADVYRGALTPAHYIIERDLLRGLQVLADVRPGATDLTFASSQVQLVAVLDAGLRTLGRQALDDIALRWQPQYLTLAPARPAASSPPPARTMSEGELRVVFDGGFAPISQISPSGGADGLAIEMFRRSAEAAGLRYRLIPHDNFASAIGALRSRSADVLVAAVRTPERLADGRFVGPYYTAPSAIVSRLDGGWPSLTSLSGQTLAIDAEHYLIPIIQREAPGVHLQVVPTAAGVLAAVAQNQADAGITNIEVASALVGSRYVGRLQVSGLVESHPSELYFMVRPDRPELVEALKAGFDSIPENERRVMANALLRTNIQVGPDWHEVALIGGPLLAGVIVLWLTSVWSSRRLRLERDRANHAAQARADFVADMSHEVRTPLVALAAGLRLLGQQAMSDDAQRVLKPLLSSSDRLVELLNTLLDMARLDAGKLEIRAVPVDLVRLVTDAAHSFEPLAATKGLALRVEVDDTLPAVMVDPQRAHQIVNNLLGNAIKFTEQGEVAVQLSGRATGARRWELTLRVRDTGPGMSEEVRAGLFARFAPASDAQRRKGGTGLGLAIVRQLIERGGGRITVTSTPGRGSEFVVVVSADAAVGAAGPELSLRRVLLVDDDPVNLLVFAARLRQRGFDVETAGGHRQAEACLERRQFDLVLTDWNMGEGGTGRDLASWVARSRHGTSVLVLSGDDAPTVLPYGVDAWLCKPRHTDDLNWLQAVEAFASTAAMRELTASAPSPADRPSAG